MFAQLFENEFRDLGVYQQDFPGLFRFSDLFTGENALIVFAKNMVLWDDTLVFHHDDFTNLGKVMCEGSREFWYTIVNLMPYTMNLPDTRVFPVTFKSHGDISFGLKSKPFISKTRTGLEILHDKHLLGYHGITLPVGYDSFKFWEMQYLDTKLVQFIMSNLYLEKYDGHFGRGLCDLREDLAAQYSKGV